MKKFILCVTSFVLAIILFSSNNYSCMALANVNNEFDNFSSTSYLLMDDNSSVVLYSFSANQKMPVASICKLMTTLLTLESVDNGTLNLYGEVVARVPLVTVQSVAKHSYKNVIDKVLKDWQL